MVADYRKLLKTLESFPNEGLIVRILYLPITPISGKWTMPVTDRDAPYPGRGEFR